MVVRLPLCSHARQRRDATGGPPERDKTVVGQPSTVQLTAAGRSSRTAIARALLRRPRLLLLDEVTPQLDAVNEQRLRDVILELAAETTVLVIAHRLSTVVHADRIVVLEDGRVRTTGRHDELVESDGLYRETAITQLTAQQPVPVPTPAP